MRWGIAALASVLGFGCSVGSAGWGGDCARSTECKAGLVCIDGMCTDDLSLLEDPGAVPDLTEPDAGAPPVDGALPDAALPVVDAASPMVDAALPMNDAALPVVDAALPVVDAALPPPDAA